MRRLVGTLVGMLLIVAMPALYAGQMGDKKDAEGTVSAASPSTLTVKGKGTEEWMFTIDKDTEVTARGATHKSLALKAEGKATMLTDFVKIGDVVNVTYHDMGKMKHAAQINVTKPAMK